MTAKTGETGPIYGVELIDTLPLAGSMRQAMPSRADLERVRKYSERTVAGYEVLLQDWHGLDEALREIAGVMVPPAESEAEYIHQRVIYRLRDIALKALRESDE
jgi:hypothetical protein